MQKIFEAYASRKGVDVSTLRFLYDGERIAMDATPKTVSSHFFFFFFLSPHQTFLLLSLHLWPKNLTTLYFDFLFFCQQLELEDQDQIDCMLEQHGG